MRTPTELVSAFRAQGLKVTPQRQLLFRLLHDNRTHPTAEALYAVASEMMPGISLRTIYQTLNDLAAMGELQVVSVGSGSTRFDPNVDQHHHAQCSACGTVSDVYVDDLTAMTISGLEGFAADSAHIVFFGLCRSCSAADSSPAQQPNTRSQP